MSRARQRAFFAATFVALACAEDAIAGAVQRAFQVGAVVVASARISSTAHASAGTIEVRALGHGSAPARLLVDGELKAIGETGTILAVPLRGDVRVTVLY
jgi:hypothetical protein